MHMHVDIMYAHDTLFHAILSKEVAFQFVEPQRRVDIVWLLIWSVFDSIILVQKIRY
jgi:hypothetical protein